MSDLNRYIVLPTVIALFLSGCGGNRNSRLRAGAGPRVNPGRHVDTYAASVADRTRVATIKRQGKWSLTSDSVQRVSDIVADSARTHALPEDLIYGIIWVESRFDPGAVSPVGARGLMQLMPRTATYLADCIDWPGRANPFDPEFNIAAGTYYLARLIQDFGGNEDLALAAYNAGPAKVRRWLKEDGLPEVSVEYATMVQTARSFFQQEIRPPRHHERGGEAAEQPGEPVITDEALDRLGLTILIAGLGDRPFGLEREDDPSPFN